MNIELAPAACVVCGKPAPEAAGKGWTYLAGSVPIGSLVCSRPCLKVAMDRHEKTGRVDRAIG